MSVTDRTGSKPNVFVSYSHKDIDKVRRIVSSLIRMGVNVWLDEKQLKIGDQLVPEISRAISETDFYLVFLSKNSVNSPYVLYELTNAMTLQITKNRPRVIPVKLDDSSVPNILVGFVHIKMESLEQVTEAIMKTMEQAIIPTLASKNELVETQEISMPIFSFFICDKTRNINSFTHKELEDKTELIKKELRAKANTLLLNFVPVEEMELNTSNIPYVSFRDEVKDSGAVNVENREVCWEVEILNPDEDKITKFISKERERVNAVQYVFLLPSPKANLGSEIYKNIMREHRREIDEIDVEGGISYKDRGRNLWCYVMIDK